MTIKINILNKAAKLAFIYKTLLFCSVVLISSCDKLEDQYLNKEPLTQYPEALIWNDPSLIESFINNIYRYIPNEFRFYSNNWLSGLCDEANVRNNTAYNIVNEGQHTPSTSWPIDYWTGANKNNSASVANYSYYTLIYYCNIFLEKVDQSPLDATIKNQRKGEVKAIRAWAYFNLVNFYGGVPLITKTFGLKDEFSVPRNTYDECMNFVITELDEAAGLLPLDLPKTELGRISPDIVMAIKSRVLLYRASPLNNPTNDQAKWQAAANAAKAVIDLGKFSLFPDYKKLFLEEDVYNSEIIWQCIFNSKIPGYNVFLEPQNVPNGYNGLNCQLHPLQNLVDDYEMLSGLLPKDDPAYNPQNPYVDRDPRFYKSIIFDGTFFLTREVEFFLPGGKDSPEGALSPWNASQSGYAVRKFFNEKNTNPGWDSYSSTPYTYIRYAEILLNYAECMYYLGQEATCREYINMIRSRPDVNMPPVTESGAALLARLQHERKIELVFENHRYFDVRRWKIAPIVLNINAKKMSIWRDPATGVKTYTVQEFQTRAFFDKNYLAPIPQSEIDKNSLLVQNPGY